MEVGLKEVEEVIEKYREECEKIARELELEFLELRYTYYGNYWRFYADFKLGETKITIPVLELIKTIKVVHVFKVVENIENIENELKDVLNTLSCKQKVTLQRR